MKINNSIFYLEGTRAEPSVIGHAPTPLDPAPNMGAALVIDMWIKREDCTGLALGGNKVRQLEFDFGAVQACGAVRIRCWSPVRCSRTWCASPPRVRTKFGMEAHIQLEERAGGAGGSLPHIRQPVARPGCWARRCTLSPRRGRGGGGRGDGTALAAEGCKPYVIHSEPGHPPRRRAGCEAVPNILGRFENSGRWRRETIVSRGVV